MLSTVGSDGARAAATRAQPAGPGAVGMAALDSTAGTADAPGDSGQRRRIKRSDYPDMDDMQYKEMMAKRRKEREAERDRNRDRTGRSHAAQDAGAEMRAASYPSRRQQSAAAGLPAPSQRMLYDNLVDPSDSWSKLRLWTCEWSEELPLLVLRSPNPVNPDVWWMRLEKHGFVAGNMLTSGVETDQLGARARDRRHSV